ncbi:hypothetical protein LIS82_13945 [Cytobacillus solani]|uniref:hypothetical protein n=1 Tax=Cytobacillus solani TaxID=1637975 RepID=UPI0020796126|nr:hypothetical protein [Cytobacillus solani]USK52742.1 hypothetical protein LIS82_13945 [Cytobacillus solani]
MAITLPHIEDANRTTYLPPKGEFERFTDESHYIEKVREWGLSTTKEVKKEFWYKERDHQRIVKIKGFETYGQAEEFNTVIVEFQDGNLSCIHPAYLKEMQASSFGKVSFSDVAEPSPAPSKKSEQPNAAKPKAVKKETATKKEKQTKIELPEEKVHFTATVKQFALSWNHFNEENDEVVVFENIVIEQANPIKIGLAWCAHSKTLKKFELAPGEKLEFDGKIVKKKLPNGKDVEEDFIVTNPVLYKINNPSKLKKS